MSHQTVRSFVRTLAAGLFVWSAAAVPSLCYAAGQADTPEARQAGAGDEVAAGPQAADAETAEAGADDTDAATERAEDEMMRFVNEPWTGDLDGMLERGMIRALVVPSQTMYFSDKGRQRGIAYEMLSIFQDRINKKYPYKVKHIKTYVAFVPVARDRLIPALLEGRGDIAAAALTITPERRKLVDFSDPFFQEIDEIPITGADVPPLAGPDALSGREVFVRRSSSYWEHLERLNARLTGEGKAPVQLDPAPEELEDEDLMEMVNAGLSGIIVVDNYKAELWAKVFPNIRLHADAAINEGGEIGWAFRKGSPKLAAEANAFAKDHGAGTSVGNTLIRRYVDSTKFVKRATSPEELEKFNELVDIFRRYADQYDMDHLLMLAQGYQESRLDHKARSPVGAIGIMQLMPATGAQMKVGNVRELEANIHAGVKYIRHVQDHYFKDEPMDALNKTLFSFAAYNAGPGRIRGLRKAAEKSGLDPNVWFDNVELMAARKIGSETVTYVSNIFKYYVAYRRVEEEGAARRAAKETLQEGME